MANNHGFILSTSMASWNVDAARIAGIYNTSDIDNGVVVTLGDMAMSTATGGGYEYNVVPATANSTACWIIDTPLPGAGVESQIFDDPRYFYNAQGRGLSLRHLTPQIDHIEVDANCFVGATAPTAGQTIVTIGANGKLVAGAGAAPAQGCYFTIVASKNVDVGVDLIPTWILRCERN